MDIPVASFSAHARRLAWLATAPSLVKGSDVFEPRHHLPSDWQARLASLAGDESLVRELDGLASGRLGRYFERLYRLFLDVVLGWEVLARNVPVRRDGRTLGELDFIVRDPHTGAVEHHEVAVKFYLWGGTKGRSYWYGPNSRDRLDLKLARMRGHQLPLSQTPDAAAVLADLSLPAPQRTRLYVPGYLFASGSSAPTDPVLQATDACSWVPYSTPTLSTWCDVVALPKPDWLGPYSQADRPDAARCQTALRHGRDQGRAQLFAHMVRNEDGCWHEQYRVFVVPDDWPAQ